MKYWFMNVLLFTVTITIIIGLFLMKQRVVEYEKQLNRKFRQTHQCGTSCFPRTG